MEGIHRNTKLAMYVTNSYVVMYVHILTYAVHGGMPILE